ncbi:M48 family metalloprotease [Methylophilaceae bacterium]|nr:M48 family metalloprotease [Methylophilaceae bacterium]
MSNLDQSFIQARDKFNPLIIPYIKEYIKPPSGIVDLDSIKKNDLTIKQLSKDKLMISDSSLPEVNKSIDDVCRKLGIDRNLLVAYVYPAMEISAYALTTDALPITIALSAGAIQRLNSEELNFVIGHEIGHALIGQIISFDANSNTLEDMIYARGLEISSDRIGLMATKNVEYAERAILKLLSGLDDKFLKNSNIQSILSENEIYVTEDDLYSSHPPLLLRIDALYKLSISDFYNNHVGNKDENQISLENINQTITSILKQSVDMQAYEKIDKAAENLIIWPLSLLVLNQIKIDIKDLSEKFQIKIIKEDIQKALTFINSYSGLQKAAVFYEKVNGELIHLNRLAPRKVVSVNENFRKLFPTVDYTDIEYLKSVLN